MTAMDTYNVEMTTKTSLFLCEAAERCLCSS